MRKLLSFFIMSGTDLVNSYFKYLAGTKSPRQIYCRMQKLRLLLLVRPIITTGCAPATRADSLHVGCAGQHTRSSRTRDWVFFVEVFCESHKAKELMTPRSCRLTFVHDRWCVCMKSHAAGLTRTYRHWMPSICRQRVAFL